MIDARIQIKELLESIDFKGLKVKMNYPKEVTSVPLVTFFELTNTSTRIKVRDGYSIQVDIWTEDFESNIDLMQEVDSKIMNLGFTRDFVSPDADCIDASGYYRKTLRYSCFVDIRTNRIIT